MRILNLFAGIGGNRTLWGDEHEITAIENHQGIAYIYYLRFPNDKIIIGDAYKYLVKHYKEFDFIWASPPCESHSRLNFLLKPQFKKLPDLRLFELIIFLKQYFWGKWVVENVDIYYEPFIKPTIKLGRHLFWSNFHIPFFNFDEKGNYRYLTVKELCDRKCLDYNMITTLPAARKHARNAVSPEIGKYILNSINITTLDKYTK